MAVGMNDCRYRVVLLRGILNLLLLSMPLLSNSGVSGCVSSAKFVLGLNTHKKRVHTNAYLFLTRTHSLNLSAFGS